MALSKKKIVLIVIALVLIVLIVCNLSLIRVLFGNWFAHKETLEEDEWTGGTSYMNVQYSDVSETNYLHLFVPDTDSGEKLPCYIFIHGGGFFFNDLDSRQAELFYEKVRAEGYAVATINYRLGSEASYPAAIEDVKAAVRFLRANADKYGIDADQFAIAGESAGGYLASMVAVTTDDEFNDEMFIGEDELDEPVSAKVQALVDYYGCIEFLSFEDEWKELGIPKFIRSIANSWLGEVTNKYGVDSVEEAWIGKSVDEMTEDELETYYVSYYAKKNLTSDSDLKILVLHGDADITVPYLESEKFANLCADLVGEDKVTYRLFPNLGHAADSFYSADSIEWVLDEVGFSK